MFRSKVPYPEHSMVLGLNCGCGYKKFNLKNKDNFNLTNSWTAMVEMLVCSDKHPLFEYNLMHCEGGLQKSNKWFIQ